MDLVRLQSQTEEEQVNRSDGEIENRAGLLLLDDVRDRDDDPRHLSRQLIGELEDRPQVSASARESDQLERDGIVVVPTLQVVPGTVCACAAGAVTAAATAVTSVATKASKTSLVLDETPMSQEKEN